MKQVILFVNQFFAGVGGEAQADFEPAMLVGPVGPGIVLSQALSNAVITHTLVCGDNFMNSNQKRLLHVLRIFWMTKNLICS